MDMSWIDKYPPVDKDGDGEDAEQARVSPKRVKIDDTIDLHGYKLDEALLATRQFLEQSVNAGYRKILIVHGKGDNGSGVIKREVRAMLERDSRAGQMGYAKGSQGGTGALWVMLRGEAAAEDGENLEPSE